MTDVHALTVTLALCACAIAAWTDLVASKVPNWLTFPLLALAPLLAALAGVRQALVALAIVIVALVLGAIAHTAGVFGGGDVKLFAAIAGIAGFPACLDVALYTALAGGVLAIVVAVRKRALRRSIGRIVAALGTAAVTRRPMTFGAGEGSPAHRIPYALAIAAGFTITTLGQSSLPALRILG